MPINPYKSGGLDLEARYKVEGYPGIAWAILRHPMNYYVHSTTLVNSAGDVLYSWSDDDNAEEVEDLEHVIMVMVGDDVEHTFEYEQVEEIPEGSYCPGCGQIGCHAYEMGE